MWVKHELRVDAALQILEELLDLAAAVGQEAVPEARAPRHGPLRRRRGTPRRSRAPPSPAVARRREHDPVDLESGFDLVSVSNVPPQPISMSSAWQPIASTRRSGSSGRQAQRVHQPGALSACSSRPTLSQGALTRLVQGLEALPVLDRVHRPEEPVVRIRDELVPRDQPRERLLDQLVARLDQVEDLAPEDEEAAVDADVQSDSCPRRASTVPSLVGRHEMGVELRPHREEHRRLLALVERVDDVWKGRIREAVAVGREEHLVVADVRLDDLEPLTDGRVGAGVDERDRATRRGRARGARASCRRRSARARSR